MIHDSTLRCSLISADMSSTGDRSSSHRILCKSGAYGQVVEDYDGKNTDDSI